MRPLILQVAGLTNRVIPSGGTIGQVLGKTSNNDYEVAWITQTGTGSYTEIDPIFTASPAFNITPTNITNWNNSYSWGNHALVGYLTTESDPIFVASPSYTIGSTNITNWNTSYGWGNHASAGYITTETDPVFVASDAYSITSTNISNWNDAYSKEHVHSNFSLLESIISTGSGTKALFNDGTYKDVASVAGGDKQIQYNNINVQAGDSTLTFDNSSKTLSATNIIATNSLQIGNATTYISKDSGNNMVFTDAIIGSRTLASIVAGATNYWTASSSNIYFGNKVGIGGTGTFTETLEVTGNISANYFNSAYLRYKNSNLLLGPNAGDNETGSGLLYIDNTNTSTPLIGGDFTNRSITLNGDAYINAAKRFCFGDSTVSVRRDSTNNLIFQDQNANGGSPITLSQLTTLTGYALKSDFISYGAVTTITAANLVTWGKASVLITGGSSSSFLSADGTYHTVTGGGVVPTDNIFKWDTSSLFYRPYSSKIEAGGTSSGGKVYAGTTQPTNANRLTYDGTWYAGYLGIGTGGNLSFTDSTGVSSYAMYNGGNPAINNMAILRNFTPSQPATVLDLFAYTTNLTVDKEATLSLVRGDDTNTELMDIYNNGYSTDRSYGIRISKAGTGVFRPFHFDFYDQGTSIKTAIYDITNTSFDFKILPTVNGTAIGLTPIDGIFKWDGTAYNPYTVQTNGKFDNSAIAPSHTDRMNYDGNLYTTNFITGTINATHGYFSSSVSQPFSASASYVGGIAGQLYTNSPIGFGAVISNQGGGTALLVTQPVISLSGSLGNPVLSISRQTSGTADISNDLISINDSPTTSGIISGSILKAGLNGTTRLDLNPRVPNGSTAVAYNFDTYSPINTLGSKLISFKTGGSEQAFIQFGGITSFSFVSSNTLSVNPTTYSRILEGSMEIVNSSSSKMTLNPNVTDGISAKAYFLSTTNTLSVVGSKLLSVLNNGVEKFSVDKDGYVVLPNAGFVAGTSDPIGGTDFGSLTKTGVTLRFSSINRMSLTPGVADGSTALAYTFDTINNLVTSGAKIVSFRNAGTQLAWIDKDGFYGTTSGFKINNAILDGALSLGSQATYLNPVTPDGSTAIANVFGTTSTYVTTGAKLISVKNNGTEKVSIDKDGNIELPTIGTGVILRSPDNTRYKITVANGGTLVVTAI